MRRMAIALVVVGLLAAGCSDGDDGEGASPSSTSTTTPRVVTEEPGTGACDDADPAACLLPWPNDRFTRADASTATGRRLDLPEDGMPDNADGTPIDPAEWNRNDGFAPASTLLTVIPDLDVEASGLPPVTDIGSSLDEDSPLVLVDADSGERVAAWAELDANAEDPDKQALMIVPAAALEEGHRHVIGLRDLVHTDGGDVHPNQGFADQIETPDAHTRATFAALDEAGVDTRELDAAWSFTVGSGDDISGRLRSMWDEVRAEVGEGAPPFSIDSDDRSGAARIIRGTFEMPQYLQGDGGPGTVLNNEDDPDGIPTANGTMSADFVCTFPAAASADDPAGTVIYGHGLLGTRDQVLDIGMLGASVGLAFCGLDYLGMSSPDVPSIVASFEDLTAFRSLPDRLQQGHLGFLLLGRLLASDEGFASDPAFQDDEGEPTIDTGEVALLGASQGGILGGVASALTDDWEQVILAVPGIGYNLLLRRSIDFDEFFPAVEASYPDELDQTLVLDLLEQLWQRGENAGYAQHLTDDPYPGVEAKDVLLLEAFGDHQVANVSTEKLARTLGPDAGSRPSPTAGRPTTSRSGGSIRSSFPSDGSGLMVWDFGTPAPPVENVPNRAGDDPHGKLANVPEALALVLSFVTEGTITDVCGDGPCQAPG
ncbi:hypothetical protein ACE2AJ_03000 [Aquihabitans daechungensis]|uniref:hypothetical protein n=1 Tax=Aquihabitans daechungensis TaxID=1052257 RepID=UPI003BA2DAD7